MEAKPSCRHISCPRIAQAIIDFISAKHVGSTAMGPTKGNRRHSRDFFRKFRSPENLAGRRAPPPPAWRWKAIPPRRLRGECAHTLA
jgi:hypothetical protein